LRLANKARALTEAYKQATIVVPLAVPRPLLGSVALDYSSPWHASGLLAAAMESAMLPSRLKDRANRDTLSGMAETLNAMGKQNIAGLQMSFTSPESEEDIRDPSLIKRSKLTEDELTEGVTLDIRFAPTDQIDSSYGRRNGFADKKKSKVFSQLIALRGYPPAEDDEDTEMDQDARNIRRRRNPSEPITRRYSSLHIHQCFS